MLRGVIKSGTFVLLVAGSTAGVYVYQHRQSAAYQIQQLETQKHELEREKQQLQGVVKRLSSEARVAEILVTDRRQVGGTTQTTLLFVETARDGSSLPPREFTIAGDAAHLDAMVIKFDRDLVAADDPLRGHSIALFTRIYGETQAPADGFPIDEPGRAPDVYRGDPAASARQAAYEAGLWRDFWRLAEDRAYRAAKGVRVANGQGVWGPFQPDRLYTVTLDADGGLNLSSEPMKAIYRELMKKRAE